jgi:hypothetical protein
MDDGRWMMEAVARCGRWRASNDAKRIPCPSVCRWRSIGLVARLGVAIPCGRFYVFGRWPAKDAA